MLKKGWYWYCGAGDDLHLLRDRNACRLGFYCSFPSLHVCLLLARSPRARWHGAMLRASWEGLWASSSLAQVCDGVVHAALIARAITHCHCSIIDNFPWRESEKQKETLSSSTWFLFSQCKEMWKSTCVSASTAADFLYGPSLAYLETLCAFIDNPIMKFKRPNAIVSRKIYLLKGKQLSHK